MAPKVIRKVRTPEGKKRYGQPIGTIITKDLQLWASARYAKTPFTVQYGLGVLTFAQLQRLGKKWNTPILGNGTIVVPATAKSSGLQGLWGLWVSDPDGIVYRWDRTPDGQINLRTVLASDLPSSLKDQLPAGSKFATKRGVTPSGETLTGVWLSEDKLPPVPKPGFDTKKDMLPSEQALLDAGEGDYAIKPPAEVMAQEPVMRWQKVDSATVTSAFAKKVGPLESPLYRLFFNGQSVGLGAKTDKGWVLLQNGKHVTPYFKTKAQLGSEAEQLWMDGTLIPDGKATLPDPDVDAADLGDDNGLVPSAGNKVGDPGTSGLTQEQLDDAASVTEQALADMEDEEASDNWPSLPFDKLAPEIQMLLKEAKQQKAVSVEALPDPEYVALADSALSVAQPGLIEEMHYNAAVKWVNNQTYGLDEVPPEVDAVDLHPFDSLNAEMKELLWTLDQFREYYPGYADTDYLEALKADLPSDDLYLGTLGWLGDHSLDDIPATLTVYGVQDEWVTNLKAAGSPKPFDSLSAGAQDLLKKAKSLQPTNPGWTEKGLLDLADGGGDHLASTDGDYNAAWEWMKAYGLDDVPVVPKTGSPAYDVLAPQVKKVLAAAKKASDADYYVYTPDDDNDLIESAYADLATGGEIDDDEDILNTALDWASSHELTAVPVGKSTTENMPYWEKAILARQQAFNDSSIRDSDGNWHAIPPGAWLGFSSGDKDENWPDKPSVIIYSDSDGNVSMIDLENPDDSWGSFEEPFNAGAVQGMGFLPWSMVQGSWSKGQEVTPDFSIAPQYVAKGAQDYAAQQLAKKKYAAQVAPEPVKAVIGDPEPAGAVAIPDDAKTFDSLSVDAQKWLVSARTGGVSNKYTSLAEATKSGKADEYLTLAKALDNLYTNSGKPPEDSEAFAKAMVWALEHDYQDVPDYTAWPGDLSWNDLPLHVKEVLQVAADDDVNTPDDAVQKAWDDSGMDWQAVLNMALGWLNHHSLGEVPSKNPDFPEETEHFKQGDGGWEQKVGSQWEEYDVHYEVTFDTGEIVQVQAKSSWDNPQAVAKALAQEVAPTSTVESLTSPASMGVLYKSLADAIAEPDFSDPADEPAPMDSTVKVKHFPGDEDFEVPTSAVLVVVDYGHDSWWPVGYVEPGSDTMYDFHGETQSLSSYVKGQPAKFADPSEWEITGAKAMFDTVTWAQESKSKPKTEKVSQKSPWEPGVAELALKQNVVLNNDGSVTVTVPTNSKKNFTFPKDAVIAVLSSKKGGFWKWALAGYVDDNGILHSHGADQTVEEFEKKHDATIEYLPLEDLVDTVVASNGDQQSDEASLAGLTYPDYLSAKSVITGIPVAQLQEALDTAPTKVGGVTYPKKKAAAKPVSTAKPGTWDENASLSEVPSWGTIWEVPQSNDYGDYTLYWLAPKGAWPIYDDEATSTYDPDFPWTQGLIGFGWMGADNKIHWYNAVTGKIQDYNPDAGPKDDGFGDYLWWVAPSAFKAAQDLNVTAPSGSDMTEDPANYWYHADLTLAKPMVPEAPQAPKAPDYGDPMWSGIATTVNGDIRLFEDSPYEITLPSNALLVFDSVWNDATSADFSVFDDTPVKGLSGFVLPGPDGKPVSGVVLDDKGGWHQAGITTGDFPYWWDDQGTKVMFAQNLADHLAESPSGYAQPEQMLTPKQAMEGSAPAPAWWEGKPAKDKTLPDAFYEWLEDQPEWADEYGSEFVYVSDDDPKVIGQTPSVRVFYGSDPMGIFSVRVGPDGKPTGTPTKVFYWDAAAVMGALEAGYHPSNSDSEDNLALMKDQSLLFKVANPPATPFDGALIAQNEPYAVNAVDLEKGETTQVLVRELTPVLKPGMVPPAYFEYQGDYYVVGDVDAISSGPGSAQYAPGDDVSAVTVMVTPWHVPDSALSAKPTGVESTPSTVSAPGKSEILVDKAGGGTMTVSLDDAVAALDILKAAKGMMIKQPLSKEDNPLWESDYHAIAEPYQGDFKGEKFHTKLAYMKALETLIANAQPSKPEPEAPGSVEVSFNNASFHGQVDVPATAMIVVVNGQPMGWIPADEPDKMYYPEGADKTGWINKQEYVGGIKPSEPSYVLASQWGKPPLTTLPSHKAGTVPVKMAFNQGTADVPEDAVLVVLHVSGVKASDGSTNNVVGWVLPNEPSLLYYPDPNASDDVGHIGLKPYLDALGDTNYGFVTAKELPFGIPDPVATSLEEVLGPQEKKSGIVQTHDGGLYLMDGAAYDAAGNPIKPDEAGYPAIPSNAILVFNDNAMSMGVQGVPWWNQGLVGWVLMDEYGWVESAHGWSDPFNVKDAGTWGEVDKNLFNEPGAHYLSVAEFKEKVLGQQMSPSTVGHYTPGEAAHVWKQPGDSGDPLMVPLPGDQGSVTIYPSGVINLYKTNLPGSGVWNSAEIPPHALVVTRVIDGKVVILGYQTIHADGSLDVDHVWLHDKETGGFTQKGGADLGGMPVNYITTEALRYSLLNGDLKPENEYLSSDPGLARIAAKDVPDTWTPQTLSEPGSAWDNPPTAQMDYIVPDSDVQAYAAAYGPLLEKKSWQGMNNSSSLALAPDGTLGITEMLGAHLEIPMDAVVMVGETDYSEDEEEPGEPAWHQRLYGWIDKDGILHNFGSPKQFVPYGDWLKSFPPKPGTLKFLPQTAYLSDILGDKDPVTSDNPGHFDTYEAARAALDASPGKASKESIATTLAGKPKKKPKSTPTDDEDSLFAPAQVAKSPLHPSAPPAAGRWGKKGSKGYVDVFADGSGVYVSPGGKKTAQTPVQVRERISKGLTLQVPASSWPHHAQPSSPTVHMYYRPVRWNPDKHGYETAEPGLHSAYHVNPDGSVVWQDEADGVKGEMTAEEFAAEIKSATDQGYWMQPRVLGGGKNEWSTSVPDVPLFPDLDTMKKAADNGGVVVFGVLIKSSDDPFFDALDSDAKFAAWMGSQHHVKTPYKPWGANLYYTKGSPTLMRQAVLRMLGQDTSSFSSPTQQGRYSEQGPFWVHNETGGAFVPQGAVREIVRQRIPVGSLSNAQMVDVMTQVVADLGLEGILYTKKGGMTKAKKASWLTALQSGDFAKIKQLEKSSGNDSPMLDFLPDKVIWEAEVPSELPAGSVPPGKWSSESLYKSNPIPDDEVANYLIAARMAYPEYLSDSERREWVKYHRLGMTQATNGLSVTARKRFLAGEPTKSKAPVYNPDVQPSSTWTKAVKSGQVFSPSVWNGPDQWSMNAVLNDWYEDEIAGHTLAQMKSAYPGNDMFFDTLFLGYADGVTFGSAKPTLNEWKYAQQKQQDWYDQQSKIPVLHFPSEGEKNKSLKKDPSTHPTYFVKDQFGKDWVFKEMPEKFRVEVELMATQIATMYGFRMPDAFPVVNGPDEHHSLKGKIGFASKQIPNTGTLEGVDVSSLTPTQWRDLALDHVLDWLLDNDDSRHGNYLMAEDGHIVAIDKSRAYKHFGVWKGLSGNKSADTNADLVSTELFAAIKSGKISEHDAQALYKAAVQKAQAIQDAPWEPLRDLIVKGNANRTQWYPSNTPQGIDQLLAGVKARKDHLAEDIESVWSKVFKEAGYEPPAVPKAPGQQRYTTVDAQFDANLDETKILGQSLMVGGSGWEEGHILFWKERIAKQPVVRGMGHIFGPAHKQLYVDLHEAAGSSASQSYSVPETPDVKARLQIADWRTDFEMTFVQFSKDHSNLILGKDSGKEVTIEEVETAAVNGKAAWQQQKATILKNNPEINPAYLDMFDAQVDAWIDSMETELKSAIAEKRKVERPPLYYPFMPITTDPKTASPSWGELWNTVVDKYGTEHTLDPSDPRWTTPPDIDSVPPLLLPKVGSVPQKELTEWEQRFPEFAKAGITLSVRPIKGTAGTLHQKTLDLDSSDGAGLTEGWEGYEYVLTLPTGEEVMIAGPSATIKSSGSGNGNPFGPTINGYPTLASRAGMIRFEGKPGESAEQTWDAVKPVLEALEPVDPPSDTDLQVLYYRMLAGSFQHRKSPPVKHQQLLVDYVAKVKELGGVVKSDKDAPMDELGKLMTPEEEAAFWAEEFRTLVGDKRFNAFIMAQGWRPRFETDPRSGLPSGHPFWYRVDADPEEVFALNYWATQDGMTAEPFVWTGMQSTDERCRVTGKFIHGQSSDDDQANGSGTVIYTTPGPVGGGKSAIIMSPMIGMRIGTYGFPTDYWGKPWLRQQYTPVSVTDMITDSHHELLPKWQLWWNDVLAVNCETEQVRKGLLMDLKKAGITEIRGIPVEDFLAVGVSDMRSKAEVNFKREKKRIAEQMANEGWI